jgi:farnesyl diphosphate synthase
MTIPNEPLRGAHEPMTGAAPLPLAARIEGYRQRIEAVLDRALPVDDVATARLVAAMRYSVLGGGKRLRAILVYAAGASLGVELASLDAAAAAVELIHAYSLIHDDLPAMDDDDLRRGRPSCHRAFDEGTAILAGDALQARAFELLASAGPETRATVRLEMLAVLAQAIGTLGMAGGQAIDLGATGASLSPSEIELMHRRKTGALIQASIELGALAAGQCNPAARAALKRFGAEIGLAFQIQDDILDVTGDTQQLGKKAGADAALGKPTYPSILGLDAARSRAHAHRDLALDALNELGAAATELRELGIFVVDRAH